MPDISPERDPGTGRESSKLNIVVFILLLASVLAVAFIIYLKSQNIDLKNVNIKDLANRTISLKKQENEQKKSFEFKYDSKEQPVFEAYKDLLIKCTKEYIKAFDKKGEEQWSIPVSFINPIIKTNESDLLVADIGGKEVYVLSGRDIKWNKKLDGNILNADISESGHVTIVQESKGYKGAVKVFNLQGNEFFTRNIAESFIVSAKVAPGAKEVMISSIDASGVKAGSSIEFTDILGKPVNKITRENSALPYTWYLSNGNILAVGLSEIVCLDKERRERWKNDFTGKRVHAANVCLGKYGVVAVGADDKGGILDNDPDEVKIFNASGQQAGMYQPDSRTRSIDVYSDVIAVNAGRVVHFISTKGKLQGKYTSKSDIVGVKFFSKQEAAVISKVGVDIVQVR